MSDARTRLIIVVGASAALAAAKASGFDTDRSGYEVRGRYPPPDNVKLTREDMEPIMDLRESRLTPVRDWENREGRRSKKARRR